MSLSVYSEIHSESSSSGGGRRGRTDRLVKPSGAHRARDREGVVIEKGGGEGEGRIFKKHLAGKAPHD